MKMSEVVQSQVFSAIRRWQREKRRRREDEVYFAEHGYFPPGLGPVIPWHKVIARTVFCIPQSEAATSWWTDLFKEKRT